MRWVKASVRLPGNDNPQFIRINGEIRRMGNFYEENGRKFLYIPISHPYSINQDKFNRVEWLDESESPSPCSEMREALQGLVNDVRSKPNDTRYATHLKIADLALSTHEENK